MHSASSAQCTTRHAMCLIWNMRNISDGSLPHHCQLTSHDTIAYRGIAHFTSSSVSAVMELLLQDVPRHGLQQFASEGWNVPSGEANATSASKASLMLPSSCLGPGSKSAQPRHHLRHRHVSASHRQECRPSPGTNQIRTMVESLTGYRRMSLLPCLVRDRHLVPASIPDNPASRAPSRRAGRSGSPPWWPTAEAVRVPALPPGLSWRAPPRCCSCACRRDPRSFALRARRRPQGGCGQVCSDG